MTTICTAKRTHSQNVHSYKTYDAYSFLYIRFIMDFVTNFRASRHFLHLFEV